MGTNEVIDEALAELSAEVARRNPVSGNALR